jgi:hypothetical protein
VDRFRRIQMISRVYPVAENLSHYPFPHLSFFFLVPKSRAALILSIINGFQSSQTLTYIISRIATISIDISSPIQIEEDLNKVAPFQVVNGVSRLLSLTIPIFTCILELVLNVRLIITSLSNFQLNDHESIIVDSKGKGVLGQPSPSRNNYEDVKKQEYRRLRLSMLSWFAALTTLDLIFFGLNGSSYFLGIAYTETRLVASSFLVIHYCEYILPKIISIDIGNKLT